MDDRIQRLSSSKDQFFITIPNGGGDLKEIQIAE
jgi:hypothetical protein